MHSNLIDGKLVPPTSIWAALKRIFQLAGEIAKIERSLAEANREKAFRTRAEYAAWRTRASSCLSFLREEDRQIAAWLRSRGQDVSSASEGSPRGQEEDEYADFWSP